MSDLQNTNQLYTKSELMKLNVYWILYVWLFCLHIILCLYMCLVTEGSRRGCYILWNWCYRCLWSSCACWELTPGFLEEQSLLLTTEPSVPPQKILLLKCIPCDWVSCTLRFQNSVNKGYTLWRLKIFTIFNEEYWEISQSVICSHQQGNFMNSC